VTALPAKQALAFSASKWPTDVDVEQHPDADPTQFVINIYRAEDSIKARYYDCCDETKPPVPLQRHTLKLPEGAEVLEKETTSNVGQIAYHLQITSTSPFLTWLHRILPFVQVHTTVTEAIWLSRSDGQDFHELGHLPVRLQENTDTDQMWNLEWLPDDKKLSFTYQNTLYVVPVDARN
jgi:hypothetical protein